MKNRILYYVEGSTEENLINKIKNKYILPGKVEKFNCWESDVLSICLRNIKANKIIIIFDTDKHDTSSSKFNTFKNNIEKLQYKREIILISQNKNIRFL